MRRDKGFQPTDVAWCFGGRVGGERRKGGPRRAPGALQQGKGRQFASVSGEASPPLILHFTGRKRNGYRRSARNGPQRSPTIEAV
jgi:hypothetical protein